MNKFSFHPFLLIVFLFALVQGFIYEMMLLFTIVLIHECGHAVMATIFGWRIKKIELHPFGGVVEVEEHGNRPVKQEWLVIAAGPFMNGLMLAVAFLLLSMGIRTGPFLYQFVEYNLYILVFNLLPIWPLDGGKFFQLMLSLFKPFKQAIKHSLWVSAALVMIYIIIVCIYFPDYLTLWIMASFFVISQWLEYRQYHYQFMRFLMERQHRLSSQITEQDVINLPIFTHQQVKEAVERMFRHKKHYFCVFNREGQLVNILSEQEMLHYYFQPQHAHRPLQAILSS